MKGGGKMPKSKVIIPEDGLVTIHSIMSHQQYSVLKMSLKHYANGYGLDLLRSLEKAEIFKD